MDDRTHIQPSKPSDRCPSEVVHRCLQVLISAYRKDDYADPVAFLAQLGAILERYPREVVEDVTSPFTGLQRRLKFPPSVAEVVEACEAEHARRLRLAKYSAMSPVNRISGPRRPNGDSTRSSLLLQFGVTDIPKSWSAVELTQAAAKYGDKLQEEIDKVIATEQGGTAQWPQIMGAFDAK